MWELGLISFHVKGRICLYAFLRDCLECLSTSYVQVLSAVEGTLEQRTSSEKREADCCGTVVYLATRLIKEKFVLLASCRILRCRRLNVEGGSSVRY